MHDLLLISIQAPARRPVFLAVPSDGWLEGDWTTVAFVHEPTFGVSHRRSEPTRY